MILKPCPFCGSNDVLNAGGDMFGIYVRCCNCGIHGPARDSLSTAAEAWNTRAVVEPDRKESA